MFKIQIKPRQKCAARRVVVVVDYSQAVAAGRSCLPGHGEGSGK